MDTPAPDGAGIIRACKANGWGIGIASANDNVAKLYKVLGRRIDNETFTPEFFNSSAFQYHWYNKSVSLEAIRRYYDTQFQCMMLFDDLQHNQKWAENVDVTFRLVNNDTGVAWKDFMETKDKMHERCSCAKPSDRSYTDFYSQPPDRNFTGRDRYGRPLPSNATDGAAAASADLPNAADPDATDGPDPDGLAAGASDTDTDPASGSADATLTPGAVASTASAMGAARVPAAAAVSDDVVPATEVEAVAVTIPADVELAETPAAAARPPAPKAARSGAASAAAALPAGDTSPAAPAEPATTSKPAAAAKPATAPKPATVPKPAPAAPAAAAAAAKPSGPAPAKAAKPAVAAEAAAAESAPGTAVIWRYDPATDTYVRASAAGSAAAAAAGGQGAAAAPRLSAFQLQSQRVGEP